MVDRRVTGSQALYEGKDFEDVMLESWLSTADAWVLRLRDGKGTQRPADTLVILGDVNLLIEYKRTKSNKFSLGLIKKHQIEGLIDFESINQKNFGLVFIHFSSDSISSNSCYCTSILHIIRYIRDNKRVSIPYKAFKDNTIPCYEVKKMTNDLYNLDEMYMIKELIK